ncbi:TPA: PD-(D/E)XK motif protein [Yersinia enterocolitica]|nr:PD-(D/E)XK motif protein [Yersinia enterocolitica]HEM6615222.1 PD-(D/E)XK motif protein [Yersinia enterocolitica]
MVPLSKTDLLAAWKALDSSHASENYFGEQGWRGVVILEYHGCQFYAGRRHPDNEEILVIFFSKLTLQNIPLLPTSKGFRVEVTGLRERKCRGLMINRQQSGNADIFTTMTLDIINILVASNTKDNTLQLTLILKRIRLWQAFMERELRPLSQREEVGLSGELTCLQQLLDSGMEPVTAIKSWVGPQHGIQDFKVEHAALEVKSTTTVQGFCVNIHSLEQLDHQRMSSLALCGYRFSEHPSGLTLNQRVQHLYQGLKGHPLAASIFEGTLCHAGYLDDHAEFYTSRFLLMNTYCWVIDDTFPRLTHANVPLPVVNVCYQMELQSLLPRSQDLSYYLSVFVAGLTDGTY